MDSNNFILNFIIKNNLEKFKDIDLRDEIIKKKVFEISNLLYSNYDISKLKEFKEKYFKNNCENKLFILSLYNAISKKYLKKIDNNLNEKKNKTKQVISIIFAVYGEQNRIKTQKEHPHGEDLVNEKFKQISWLFNGIKYLNWEIIVVDDGCPNNSGKLVEEIIKNNNLKNIKVLYLRDILTNKNYNSVKKLNDVSESRKGGSILLGLEESIKNNSEGVSIYTDADLSTNLSQIGLLLEPIYLKNKLVSIGSRREKESVVVKKGLRNDRGKLFIYLWKKLIPNLDNIIDTQCGFKAFKKEVIPEIIYDNIEFKFAFDIELLVKFSKKYGQNKIEKVPIVWLDSDEESTTKDLNPYLDMLKSIVKFREKYFMDLNVNKEYIGFIKNMTSKDFDKLVKNIPEEIIDTPVEKLSDLNINIHKFRENILD
jgi:hypothetical protein